MAVGNLNPSNINVRGCFFAFFSDSDNLKDMNKKYIAEFLGTLTLTLAVIATLVARPDMTPLVAGLVLLLFVYSIGDISGSHINPAVTIGLFSIKKISGKDAGYYILSQILGAFAALFIASVFIIDLGVKLGVGSHVSSGIAGLAEALGMFFFTFGIASVVFEKTPNIMNGFVIGGSLLLGILIASGLGSNGVLNPAVAFMTGSSDLMYILGPIIGSAGGFWAYKKISA